MHQVKDTVNVTHTHNHSCLRTLHIKASSCTALEMASESYAVRRTRCVVSAAYPSHSAAPSYGHALTDKADSQKEQTPQSQVKQLKF